MKSPLPNHAPETRISSETPRPHEATSYRVKLNWVGEDVDGRIAGYYYAWDDTVPDTLQVWDTLRVEVGDSIVARDSVVAGWQWTTANESTFVVPADSCAVPPCGGQEDLFFGYHTFWVKAVDDQGTHDPHPAHRTFTATTIAPEADLTIYPWYVCGGTYDNVSDYVFVEWAAEDPDGQVTGYWYKWDSPDPKRDYPTARGEDPVQNGWTWLPAESTSVASRRQQLNPGCAGGANSFCVFAVDDAGAIEQVIDCDVATKNYVIFCPDSTKGGPGVCLDGGVLGVRSSGNRYCDARTGDAGAVDARLHSFAAETGIFLGTGVRFSWCRLNTPGRTPAPLIGFRYSVDDPDAFSPLSLQRTTYPDSSQPAWFPDEGSHALYVEAIDKAGVKDAGVFKFVVSKGARRTEPPIPPRILLVDDNGQTGDVNYGEWSQESDLREGRWWGTKTGGEDGAVLAGYSVDEWDTQEWMGAPQVPKVAEYTTLIWNVGIPTGSYSSSLRDKMFIPRSEYLTSYVRAGGNVVLLGMCPAFATMTTCTSVGGSGSGGDICCQPPGKGTCLQFSPCGQEETENFPHFLFTRVGARKVCTPIAATGWQVEQERHVKGCLVVDSTSVFNQELHVDTWKAGGDRDTQNQIWYIEMANAAKPADLDSWVEPIYYLNSADPEVTATKYVVGWVARGNNNPLRSAAEPDWGNCVFLGIHPFYLLEDDASWFLQTVLTEICGEQRRP